MNKRGNGFGAVELIVVIIVIGLIVALGWMFVRQQESDGGKDQMDVTIEDAQPELRPQEIIEEIKVTYGTQYTLLDLDEDNQPGQNEMSVRVADSVPAYKVDGYVYYVYFGEGASIDIMVGPVDWASGDIPRPADVAIRNEIINTYEEFGLTKTGNRGDADQASEEVVYIGKGVICTTQEPSSATSHVGATCGLVEAYTDAAAQVKPFADVLPNINQSSVLGRPYIVDSEVSGYQRAQVSHGGLLGGAVALFYRKTDGEWRYFRSVQQVLECTEFDTTDLRNAFKGESCYDRQTDTVIKV